MYLAKKGALGLPKIVLYEPEIPQNTGNIARTCAATGTPLHLIEPLGFEISDKHLKRAGLDYWSHVDLHIHQDWNAFLATCTPQTLWAVSTKGTKRYTDVTFGADDFLVFGKETSGLPQALYNSLALLRIPMRPTLRSLNLSNTVALVLFEALRQQDFEGLS